MGAESARQHASEIYEIYRMAFTGRNEGSPRNFWSLPRSLKEIQPLEGNKESPTVVGIGIYGVRGGTKVL